MKVNPKAYTTEEFIIRAIKEFPEYDYSKVIYKNKRTDVIITCPLHGDFLRKPRDMFRNDKKGSGCPTCVGKRRWTKDVFIEVARTVHGNLYNYDKVQIKNSKTDIIINCPKHGDFPQQIGVHVIVGCGCPKCSLERTESKPVKFIKELISEYNLDYIQEYTFDDCKFKSLLRFDFYIESLNLLIEYDGEFHYKDWGNIYDNEKVKLQQLRDEIKTNYAKEHNINLIRVSYKDDYLNIIKTYFSKMSND